MSSSYRSNRVGLLHWDPYAVCRGSCLELYYCNMVQWFWWDSILILTTNWFPSVLWHCWFGHLACKNRPQNDLVCVEWDVKPYTLTHSFFFIQQLVLELTERNLTSLCHSLEASQLWKCISKIWGILSPKQLGPKTTYFSKSFNNLAT